MRVFSSLQDSGVVTALMHGHVGILPTDTIYGFVARAADAKAVARLYKFKRREGKPGTIIAANVDQLIDLGVDESVLKMVAPLWPNPLSIVVDANPRLNYLDQGVGSLAVRVPKDATLQALLAQTGPLLTTSANFPGEPPVANVAEAQTQFGENIDFYVEGGSRSDRPASTVVRFKAGKFELLRPGAVTIDEAGNIQ